ncbi:methylmalonyl Co-A mutase-associated GTPase MeaB [Tepidibacillus marianensis]|uniref:methylmalonyl Co-A mutase-associated GTPase MeaB n=1 Tax=Tepidibacillus marianensis TaxID=3131995 RepID=UPI0030CE0843
MVEKILRGDKRSAAKAITIIENDRPDKYELLQHLYGHKRRAHVIGITGAPGAGKSTLVDRLIQEMRKQDLKVGIIAIDPSSPFSGGALLGDRVRMQNHATDPGVFIRSMGSRGTLGGLAKATKEAVRILDIMGNDRIIIETVGVGQSEFEIMNVADTTAVVLNPGAGDSIQAFKAGLMEIADIFVINKWDLPGAQKLLHEIELLLDMTKREARWRPPIVKTISTEHTGIIELWRTFQEHFTFIETEGILDQQRKQDLEKEFEEILHHLFHLRIKEWEQANPKGFQFFFDQIYHNERNLIEATQQTFQELISQKK